MNMRTSRHRRFQPTAQILEPRLFMAADIYVDANSPGPTHDGTSWAAAYADLQIALAWATSGDRILVADGTYRPSTGTNRLEAFTLKNGVTLMGGYPGYGAASPNARNPALYPTILSGDIGAVGTLTDNSYHVVVAPAGVTSSAVLDGFTITAGYAVGDQNSGGGMWISNASPTITNCIFLANYASSAGGAMYIGGALAAPLVSNSSFSQNSAPLGGAVHSASSASPTFTNCTFNGNIATNGAGMYNSSANPNLINATFTNNTASNSGGGLANVSASPVLTDCVFSGNTAEAEGGGMYNDHAAPSLTRVTFTANTAYDGGAVYNAPSSSPTISGALFSQNRALVSGGAIYDSGSAPTVTGSTFIENQASTGGGAVFNNASSPTFSNTTFLRNSAGGGGAIHNGYSSSPKISGCIFSGNSAGASNGGAISNTFGSSPDIVNSLFVGNSARFDGGAIYSYNSSPVLTNSTLAGNHAVGNGGAASLRFGTTLTLTNSIVWGNTAVGSTPFDVDFMSGISATYSDIQGGYSGTGNLNADPLFLRSPSPGPDATWGSNDDDYGNLHLKPGSPGINAGSNSAPGLSGVTTDLAGNPRIASGTVDLGAYETETTAPTVVSTTINNGSMQRSMVTQIRVTFSEPVELSPGTLDVDVAFGPPVFNLDIVVANPSLDQKTYILTFTGPAAVGGSLPDGIYTFTAHASGVQDLAGNALASDVTLTFHRLFGDANGDRRVNLADYTRLRLTLGRSAGDALFNSALDYESNGTINVVDLAQFRRRYGKRFSY